MTKILAKILLLGLWIEIVSVGCVMGMYMDRQSHVSSREEVQSERFIEQRSFEDTNNDRQTKNRLEYNSEQVSKHERLRSRNARKSGHKKEDNRKTEEDLKSWRFNEDLLESRRFNDDLRSDQRLVEYRENTKENLDIKKRGDSRLVEYYLKDSTGSSRVSNESKTEYDIVDDIRGLKHKVYPSPFISSGSQQTSTTVTPGGEVLSPSATCVSPPTLDDSVIYAAVLLPNSSEYITALSKVQPVLRLAEDEVYRRQLFPKNLSFQFLLRDDQCDAMYSQRATFEAVKHNVNVFFGPACEYSVAPVARTLKFWSTPMLTTGALTFDFAKDKRSNTSEYHLLVRVGLLSFRDMADFLNTVLDRYGWTRTMLVYERDGCRHLSGKHTCKLMMETLVETFKQRGLHYGSYDLEKNAGQGILENLRREVGIHYTSEYVEAILSLTWESYCRNSKNNTGIILYK